MNNMVELNLVEDSSELRKLIAENPELPIVVLVESDSTCEEFAYTYMSSVSAHIGELLDCEPPWTDIVCSDRDDLREGLQTYLEGDDVTAKLSDIEFDALLEEKLKEYELLWKKAIIICAGN